MAASEIARIQNENRGDFAQVMNAGAPALEQRLATLEASLSKAAVPAD